MPTQLPGDDGSNSGVVPGEINRQNWSRPSVRGFRSVADAEPRHGLPLWPAGAREQKCGEARTEPVRWLGLRETGSDIVGLERG